MDNAQYLTEVQKLNLNFLLTIQACLKHDSMTARFRFHLDAECAAALSGMTAGNLIALAENMPHESLFQPIRNLHTLLGAPGDLAVTLCTVGMDHLHGPTVTAVAAANDI